MASERRHLLKPKRFMSFASLPFSTYSFSPTMPTSATPFATDCGMSSSRKKRTSTGKPLAERSKMRLPRFNLMPASSRSIIVSS